MKTNTSTSTKQKKSKHNILNVTKIANNNDKLNKKKIYILKINAYIVGNVIPSFLDIFSCETAASLKLNKCVISSSVFASFIALSKRSMAFCKFPLKTQQKITKIQ